MPDRSSLEALLTRVENATGADRELDEAIERWLAETEWRYGPRGLSWSASIDAALALCERVLPGWSYQLSSIVFGTDPKWNHGPSCELHNPYSSASWVGKQYVQLNSFARGHTMPLAILAATLRALLAQPAEKIWSDMPV